MKAQILRSHGIMAVELNNQILAEESDGTVTDITNWSTKKLYDWLGY